MVKIAKFLLHLAGEYRVCSELNKRGVFATMTCGNHKAVDIYAIDDLSKKAFRIEVKTSQGGKFPTGISQKKGLADGTDAPDFWVLVQIQRDGEGQFTERFLILTHREIERVQKSRNSEYAERYKSRHGKLPDFKKGVDNVALKDVQQFEGQWSKITGKFRQVALPKSRTRATTQRPAPLRSAAILRAAG